MLNIEFEVQSASNFIEFPPVKGEETTSSHAKELALKNARGKAADAAENQENALIIGVDTLGFMDGLILEKPKDLAEAKQMLQKMQGKSHSIYSGITILDTDTKEEHWAIEETLVHFAELSEEEIDLYLQVEEVLDKAAAYGIQGKASVFVSGIEGDYFNVMGLPLARLSALLKNFDINLLTRVK